MRFLVDALELDLEDEGGIWWDETWEAAVAICHLSWDGEDAALAERHLWYTLIPACDHAADTNGGLEVPSAN
jgi:hypothetical protein